jgi:hypothetical protein
MILVKQDSENREKGGNCQTGRAARGCRRRTPSRLTGAVLSVSAREKTVHEGRFRQGVEKQASGRQPRQIYE